MRVTRRYQNLSVSSNFKRYGIFLLGLLYPKGHLMAWDLFRGREKP